MYEVEFDMTFHIVGTVVMDYEPECDSDIIDAVFPNGWEGELWGCNGYWQVMNDDDNG